MGNQRFQKHTGKGAPTGQTGKRNDMVGPMKTKNWPGVPGKTGAAFSKASGGFRKAKQSASEKGVC